MKNKKNSKALLDIKIVCILYAFIFLTQGCKEETISYKPCHPEPEKEEIKKDDNTYLGTLAEIEQNLKSVYIKEATVQKYPDIELTETLLTIVFDSFGQTGFISSYPDPDNTGDCNEYNFIEHSATISLQTDDGSFDEKIEVKIIHYKEDIMYYGENEYDTNPYFISGSIKLKDIKGSYDTSIADFPYPFNFELPWEDTNIEDAVIETYLNFKAEYNKDDENPELKMFISIRWEFISLNYNLDEMEACEKDPHCDISSPDVPSPLDSFIVIE